MYINNTDGSAQNKDSGIGNISSGSKISLEIHTFNKNNTPPIIMDKEELLKIMYSE